MSGIRKMWIFCVLFISLGMSCSSLFYYRHKDDPPQSIITVTDIHENVTHIELKYVRELKITQFDLNIKYEIELHPIEPYHYLKTKRGD